MNQDIYIFLPSYFSIKNQIDVELYSLITKNVTLGDSGRFFMTPTPLISLK